MTEDTEVKDIREIPSVSRNVEDRRVDARLLPRKLTTNDKLLNPQGAISSGSITQAMLATGSVGQSQLLTEVATLTFGAADAVKTASITNGSIILGWYASAYTTPANSWLKLEISGTTLTGTLTAVPGVSNSLTIKVILLKT